MMHIWLGQEQIPSFENGCALTIGNFDGVHLGHQHILDKLKQEAQRLGVPAVLLTFEPQPKEYFAERFHTMTAPHRLTPLRDKLSILGATGALDHVWVMRFTAQFASLSAEAFVNDILIKALNVKYLLIGDDFRFGSKRSGDFATLQRQTAFVTESTPTVLVENVRASSTMVRNALAEGQLAEAAKILGRPYQLSGRVMHGAKLGRTLNCPTANIHLQQKNYALSGVFVVQVDGPFGHKGGVASFGINPTVTHTTHQKLEVHIFGLDHEIYGQRLTVTFLHKLRDEAKFDGLEALQQQIYLDMQDAQAYLHSL